VRYGEGCGDSGEVLRINHESGTIRRNTLNRKTIIATVALFVAAVVLLGLDHQAANPVGCALRQAPLKEILAADKPLFGICLGNQLLALACGISTYKMHHGHRGLNHPVKNLITGLGEMTSQNHGFAVSEKDIQKNPDVEVTHMHLNDQTIMGIRLKSKKAFSVQYHPEAAPGPHDASYFFSQFADLIEGKKSRK